MAYDFPSSPSTGQWSIQDSGGTGRTNWYIYDGSAWTTQYAAGGGAAYTTNSFRYRTLYTRGYMACGYKSGAAWRNVNRTQHYNDTTTNLGDILDATAAYMDGGFSDYYGYAWGGAFAFSTYCRGFNFSNETGRTNSSSWNLYLTGRYAMAVGMNPSNAIIYITDGGAYGTDKFQCSTETMYAVNVGQVGYSLYPHSAAIYGQYRMWHRNPYGTSYLQWTNDSWTYWGSSWPGSDGITKGLPSKYGWGYQKNGGNVATSAMWQINDTTGGIIASPGFYDPTGANGEENFHMGQDKGYMMGQYNGAQNNLAFVVTYATNASSALGSAGQPKGHDGTCSAANWSASSQIVGGY